MLALLIALGTLDTAGQSAITVPGMPTAYRYASSVSFWEGECRFWTGDVMFDGRGFVDDLKSRFDARRGLVIFHAADVPERCVADAKKLAEQAGFEDIDVRVGTVDLGPPR